MIKKITLLLAVFVLCTLPTFAQMQMQSVQGVASTSDANRHYLMHLATLQGGMSAGASASTDIHTAVAQANSFMAWFLPAIDQFNANQSLLTDATAEANAQAAFIAQRDDQVSNAMFNIYSKVTPRGKLEIKRWIAATQPKIQTGMAQSEYDRLKDRFPKDTDAERRSGTRLGDGTGSYQCQGGSFTCAITYSMGGTLTGLTTAPVSDNFNRSGGLGSGWTTLTGGFTLSSNSVKVTTNGTVGPGNAVATYNNSPTSNDQVASIQISTLPSSSQDFGIVVRAQSATTYYAADWYDDGSGHTYLCLFKVVSGTQTTLACTPGYFTPAVGDSIQLSARGSYISASLVSPTLNGTQQEIGAYDTSIASGKVGILGIIGFSADNFNAGAVGTTVSLNPLIDGTVNMNGGPPPGTLHTPKVFINGNYQAGNSVCPTCYVYENGFYSYSSLLGGAPINITDGGVLVCTLAGTFLSTLGDNGYFEFAHTTGLNQGPLDPWYGGGYSWWVPENYYDLGNLYGFWYEFNNTKRGQSYALSNYCSNTSTPDLSLSNFHVVFPAKYATGGEMCGAAGCLSGDEILAPAQGAVVDAFAELWRTSTTAHWSPIPWWLNVVVFSTLNENEEWNEPLGIIVPEINLASNHQGLCVVTSGGNYSTAPTNSGITISH